MRGPFSVAAWPGAVKARRARDGDFCPCKLVVSDEMIADAERRLARFAPFIRKCWPETEQTNGLIESPLTHIPKAQKKLEEQYGASIPGRQGSRKAPLYRFFQENSSPEALVVHKDSRKIIGFVGREVQYELLTPDVSGQIEFCLMTIPPNKASAGMPEGHEGEEAAYVVSGSINILLEDTCIALSAGDSLRIPPLTQHRWINSTTEDAVIIFAVSPPSF